MDWTSQTALVVEDSAVQRVHMVGLLREAGFGTVLEAANGRQAMRMLELHGALPVQLVVTDLDMPEMDGIELIRRLAERRMTHNLIVASARDPRLFEIIDRMASDAADFRLLGSLGKPVRMSALAPLLDSAASARHRKVPAVPVTAAASGEIAKAIRAREFEPYFQPQVCIRTGAIRGVEALARWRHRELGVLPPEHFIAVIEGTSMMESFTLLIAEETLKHLAQLHRRGMATLTASINLSADNLADRSFIGRLARLVDAHGIPASLLTWEVTETMLMTNVSESLANLARLGLKGFGLAMDDYGVGYSSIEQFARCPFTELKIDRAFVHDSARRPSRRAVLESAIEMGHRFDVQIVAEGVETRADWELLRALGCDLAQGYLISKPMPMQALWRWIAANRARLGALAATAVGGAERLAERNHSYWQWRRTEASTSTARRSSNNNFWRR